MELKNDMKYEVRNTKYEVKDKIFLYFAIRNSYLFTTYCLLLAAYFFLPSCGIYSFSGASIPADVKTFSVSLFPNKASIVVPTLSQSFTDALRDKINNETTLDLVDKVGDYEFSGAITGYTITPIAPTGNATAALNRLTITIQVDFKNNKNGKDNWNTAFSRFADYASTVNISSVENDLIRQINEQLVLDIFNKAIANW